MTISMGELRFKKVTHAKTKTKTKTKQKTNQKCVCVGGGGRGGGWGMGEVIPAVKADQGDSLMNV